MRLDVKDMRLVVVGEFSRIDRDEACAGLRKLGGEVVAQLDAEVDYLIAGAEAEDICARAQALDVPILTEHALLSILGRAQRRRREERFPTSEHLRACVAPGAEPARVEVPLPKALEGRARLELRAWPTTFETTRRFGETWGLKLSEFDTSYVGELWLDDAPLSREPGRDDIEHLYYVRFRHDGRDYASGEERFDGEGGFHASWLLEALAQLDGARPPALGVEGGDDDSPPIVWRRLEGGGARGRWMLKLNAEQVFGQVLAYEHEELHLDLDAGTWRWSHYFCPYDDMF